MKDTDIQMREELGAKRERDSLTQEKKENLKDLREDHAFRK